MVTNDFYKTITTLAQGEYTEKKSKFLAFAVPVHSVEEVKEWLDSYKKKYCDARHLCYSYVLGPDGGLFRANDNGEPSGTAGKPILGQIHSYGLTDVLIMVVRYFGGVKLGTSGLFAAYKEVAGEALRVAQVVERTVDVDFWVQFEYPCMNQVMRVVKDLSPQILEQQYDTDCFMQLRIRKSMLSQLQSRLEKVETLSFVERD